MPRTRRSSVLSIWPKRNGNFGSYRTPSLISVWATASFFHNNMLGTYTGDPSVQGRLTAFNDAAEKLPWPEKRLGLSTIKVTGAASVLKIRDFEIRVPAGTAVDLLASINVYKAIQIASVLQQSSDLLADPKRLVRLVEAFHNCEQYDKGLADLVPMLLRLNQSPDFVQDHEHAFGSDLPDGQKHALIEYMKTSEDRARALWKNNVIFQPLHFRGISSAEQAHG